MKRLGKKTITQDGRTYVETDGIGSYYMDDRGRILHLGPYREPKPHERVFERVFKQRTIGSSREEEAGARKLAKRIAAILEEGKGQTGWIVNEVDDLLQEVLRVDESFRRYR